MSQGKRKKKMGINEEKPLPDGNEGFVIIGVWLVCSILAAAFSKNAKFVMVIWTTSAIIFGVPIAYIYNSIRSSRGRAK